MRAGPGVVLLASVAAAGCLSSSTVVRVRPDGSGTVEVTTTLRKAALVELFASVDVDNRERHQPRLEDWLPEADVRAAAARIGEGVRLHAARAIQTDEVIGRVSTYEFSDVRALALEALPLLPASHSTNGGAAFHGEHRFTFDLLDEGDGRRVLIARLPDARLEYSGVQMPGADGGHDKPRDAALLRTVIGGAHLEVAIEPELPIVRLNTLHRSGQRVTLVAVDVERLVMNEDAEARLLLQPGSLDELRHRVHDIPGVTVALDREIRIELASTQ